MWLEQGRWIKSGFQSYHCWTKSRKSVVCFIFMRTDSINIELYLLTVVFFKNICVRPNFYSFFSFSSLFLGEFEIKHYNSSPATRWSYRDISVSLQLVAIFWKKKNQTICINIYSIKDTLTLSNSHQRIMKQWKNTFPLSDFRSFHFWFVGNVSSSFACTNSSS